MLNTPPSLQDGGWEMPGEVLATARAGGHLPCPCSDLDLTHQLPLSSLPGFFMNDFKN